MEDKIAVARQKRSTARTDANEFSSRSHAIFHIQIQSIHLDKKKSKGVVGTITIVDLAGSERLNQSNTEGDRLVETKAINRSLTALKDVISALVKKDKHVPYRNSKLTYVLQNYLGKDSKTLVMINISPCASHYNQTIGALRFGYMLKNCSNSIPNFQRPERLRHLNFYNEDSAQKSMSGLKALSRGNSSLKIANTANDQLFRRALEDREVPANSSYRKPLTRASSSHKFDKMEAFFRKQALNTSRAMDEENAQKTKSEMFGWENRNLLLKQENSPPSSWSRRTNQLQEIEEKREENLLRTPIFHQ